jgi:hypothetical protein
VLAVVGGTWFLASAASACRSHGHTGPATPVAADWVAEVVPDLGEVVARVGGNPIFAQEVAAQAGRTGKPPAEALQELISFHLLAERAREGGAAATVSRAEVPRGLLVQRLVEREFEPSVEERDLTDQELRGIYERFKERYVHPRIVRVALLSVFARRGQPKSVSFPAAKKAAQDLYAHVSKRPDRTPDDFARIPADRAWSSRNVSFARVWQGPDQSFGPLGAAEGAAIARLRKPGDTTTLLEAEPGAYHIARYIEEKAPKNVSFEQARDELMREYYPRWRRERFEQFASRFLDEHRIEVFGDRVLRLAAP